MVMTKKSATAAVNSIKDLTGGSFFSLIQGNQHSMQKHFHKGDALAGAQQDPQGYFKQTKEVHLNIDEYKRIKCDEKLMSKDKYSKLIKSIGAKNNQRAAVLLAGKERKYEKSISTTEDSTSNIIGVVKSVLNSGSLELREANNLPNERFMAVAPIPKGFVGRQISGAGVKTTTGIDYAVIVINASAGVATAIVTVFPSTKAYATRTSLLTD